MEKVSVRTNPFALIIGNATKVKYEKNEIEEAFVESDKLSLRFENGETLNGVKFTKTFGYEWKKGQDFFSFCYYDENMDIALILVQLKYEVKNSNGSANNSVENTLMLYRDGKLHKIGKKAREVLVDKFFSKGK